jgi:hypothetical protein
MRCLSLVGLGAALAFAACADPPRAPTALTAAAAVAERIPAADRVTAVVRWNLLTRAIIGRRGIVPGLGARAFALVSVAMYDAVIAAEDAKLRSIHPSEAGAAASAAATVLTGLFPIEKPAIDAQLAADAAYFPTLPFDRDADWAAGVTVGRGVGLAVLAYAANDGSNAPWTGTVPVGPGYWSPSPGAQPQLPQWGSMHAWLLTSNSQFRPPPPPPVGSPEFLAALAEVRSYSNLSPTDPVRIEQLRIARFWQTESGPGAAPGYLTEIAAGLVQEHHLDERKAARVFAVMDMAMLDASIACWDAKFTYWYIRPYQYDPTIATPVGFPQHPSYPSAHSCFTSSGAAVLAALFPSRTDYLLGLVAEAGEARIYAGLHYRFDVLAGRQIGYSVAALALALAPNDHEPIPLD